MIESRPVRIACLLAAFAIAAAFFVWTHAYFEPLHTGVDQNGYLVGGKQFGRTLLPRQRPTVPGRPTQFDRHAFVADMWVTAANDNEAFDPKYPIGLPLLYAISIWLTAGGTTAAFYLSPVAMALTLPAVFVVVRRFAGVYGGLLATLAFAVSPMTGALVNNPNSHAVCICCATWGMAGVLRWWDEGGRVWAVVGGLLVGYAATVRYTEGLLVLPLVWAALVRPRRPGDEGLAASLARPLNAESSELPHLSLIRRTIRRSLEPALLLAAWAMPVACLAAYNLYFLGTLTGYDATNESTGFSWTYFFENWETLVRQFGTNGLFLLLPLAVAGLVWMPWRDWRHAGFVLLYAGPIGGLYAFYYWGPDGQGYLRFFMTILPALLTAAFWLMRELTARDQGRLSRPAGGVRRFARGVAILTAGLLGAAVVFYAVRYDDKSGVVPVGDYLARPPTAYQRLGGRASLFGGVAAAGAVAAAVAATTRRTAGALAGGLVTLLSVATTADNTRTALEQAGYTARVNRATLEIVRREVPDGAMLVCRDTSLLQALQFLTDDLLYTGLSFDRNWVNGRPRAASDDPVLVDPVRGQQLFDALKSYDQKALTEQARVALRAALLAKRRVFVLDPAPVDAMLAASREKKEGPVPEFVRRYVVRPKDTTLVGRRAGWWVVPLVIKDPPRNVPRGRKTGDRFVPAATCFQLWEITQG